MNHLKCRLLLVVALGFVSMGTANAQTTQSIDVTAIVPNFCLFDPASEDAMTFDLSTVADAAADFTATTTLSWRCSNGHQMSLSIDAGGSNDQQNREMDAAGVKLPYNLYTDNTFGNIWGDGTAGTDTVGITGLGMVNVGTTTVHGRILLADAQAAEPGAYRDVVVVTILP
jgi:spore coat protein U-like protein